MIFIFLFSEYPSWTFGHEQNKSFAVFPITRRHPGNLGLSFFLRTLESDGLVFQLRRGSEVYFSVFLRKGVINVWIDSSTRTTSTFIAGGETVLVRVDARGGLVYFNGTELLFPAGSVSRLGVEVGDVAFVGGLPDAADVAPWGGYFKGCLQDVRLDDTHFYMHVTERRKAFEMPSVQVPSRSHQILERCVGDQVCKVLKY